MYAPAYRSPAQNAAHDRQSDLLAPAFEQLALDDDIPLVESDFSYEPAVFERIVRPPCDHPRA